MNSTNVYKWTPKKAQTWKYLLPLIAKHIFSVAHVDINIRFLIYRILAHTRCSNVYLYAHVGGMDNR